MTFEKRNVRINLALYPELANWIKKQAKLQNRTVNNFIETILLEFKQKNSQKKEMIKTEA